MNKANLLPSDAMAEIGGLKGKIEAIPTKPRRHNQADCRKAYKPPKVWRYERLPLSTKRSPTASAVAELSAYHALYFWSALAELGADNALAWETRAYAGKRAGMGGRNFNIIKLSRPRKARKAQKFDYLQLTENTYFVFLESFMNNLAMAFRLSAPSP